MSKARMGAGLAGQFGPLMWIIFCLSLFLLQMIRAHPAWQAFYAKLLS
jgi:uncharacterized membrane protein YeiB